jgi:ubiquinol-cytochrome c reductase iron-sulfur subunit
LDYQSKSLIIQREQGKFMSDDGVNRTRRRLIGLTAGMGAVGGAFTAWPFLASWAPSARAKAAGAPVEVDISKIEPGQMLTVEWRGKPVWILHRTAGMISKLDGMVEMITDPESANSVQPEYATNNTRAIKDKYLVLVGICTHLGCSPLAKLQVGPAEGMESEWKGGFFCPCHGSRFDLAGRVYKNVPAPTNLVVPPHTYLSDSRILIGEDKKGAA